MGYASRLPNSNDLPRDQPQGNPWIQETEMMDTFALLLSGRARRCLKCRRPIRVEYLTDKCCPDCRS
jgi:hypothetical protein